MKISPVQVRIDLTPKANYTYAAVTRNCKVGSFPLVGRTKALRFESLDHGTYISHSLRYRKPGWTRSRGSPYDIFHHAFSLSFPFPHQRLYPHLSFTQLAFFCSTQVILMNSQRYGAFINLLNQQVTTLCCQWGDSQSSHQVGEMKTLSVVFW